MKKYKVMIIALVVLLLVFIAGGLGASLAYYQTEVTGAASGSTSSYAGEVEIVSGTHTSLIPSADVVDEIEFYVKNYTGSDSSPAATSEVYLSYMLTFTEPTWASGCTNPVSFKLYSVDEATDAETEVSLASNKTGAINFDMISAEKDMYRLKLYWDTTNNSASCFAGKTGTVGISASIYQKNV